MKPFGILLGIAVVCGFANVADATVLIQENFESLAPGTVLRLEPGWVGATNAFKVDNQAGLAATGTHYLNAPRGRA